MKKIILILFIGMSLIGCRKEINEKQLQNRKEVYYEINKQTPYTGSVAGYYDNGEIKYRENYIDGEKEGTSIGYHENGEIKYKENYIDGEKEGELIAYYDNGQIKYRENYINGKKEGTSIGYYENGEIKYKGIYKNEKLEDWIYLYENSQMEMEMDYKY